MVVEKVRKREEGVGEGENDARELLDRDSIHRSMGGKNVHGRTSCDVV